MAHLAKLKFSDKQRSQGKRPVNPTYRDREDVDSVHH